MSINHIETMKQVAKHLEAIIEKIDSLDFCPILWEESYFLLHELKAVEEQIDYLSDQLYSILSDESFCDDVQNKAIVGNLEDVDNCFNAFLSHYSKINSVLEDEGPKEWYDEDYEYLSSQLKQAQQYLG